MKQEVGQAVKQWLLSNFRITQSDIVVDTNEGREAYVQVEVTTNNSEFGGFKTSKLRTVVENNTPHTVDFIPTADHQTAAIVPEGV